MVLQNNVLFSGTIRENLQWGAPDADDDTLIAAAKDAQAWEFISRFPEGLDTRIDQGGVNVSGGQKQRLCIARAMLKNPAILILDDSTSAVDSATEGLIRETFYSKYKDTTVLLVAQRISSVQYADRIIVLDRGRISAIGTHDDLMQSSELYRAIYDSQQEGGVTDE
jgi:ATP-binding cassette subfamily B protein